MKTRPTPARDRTVNELAALLVSLSHRAYALGLTPGISGNLSVRIPGEPRVLIKATGYSLGDLTPAETMVVDLDGQVLEETPLRPSKEMFFHLAIYQQRTDVAAVVHLHPPYAVAFAVLHQLPPLVSGAARAFLSNRVALVPPAPSGSRELALQVGAAFRDEKIRAALIAEHGSITVGPDLSSAFYLSQYLEDAARTAFLVKQWEALQG
jgi:L-fuculose-phosphate aldolase